MRSLQRAFEERLQIINNYWRDQGIAMLDSKVIEIGTAPTAHVRDRSPSPGSRAASPSRRDRPKTMSSVREYRILPGGYHSFIYPAQAKSLVGYGEGKREVANLAAKSHDPWQAVQPFPASSRGSTPKKAVAL
eukprot:scaffold397148_cov46-Prasinocladus_malaysianus.AAC.1